MWVGSEKRKLFVSEEKKQNERGNKKKVECNTVQCKTGLWVRTGRKQRQEMRTRMSPGIRQKKERRKETTYDNSCFGKKKKKKEENGQWGTN